MDNKPKKSGFNRRIIALGVLVLLLLALFVARLVQFQFVEKGEYLNASSSSWQAAPGAGGGEA